MHIGQFTVKDVLGCFAAVVAYIPFLLAPGFCFGYSLDLFKFRSASWPERLLASVVLSFATVPMIATLVGRYASLAVVIALFLAMTLAAIVIASRELRRTRLGPMTRTTRVAIYLCGAWILLAIFSVVDIQVGNRLYTSTIAFDQSLRTAVTGAAFRTGVPPANPLFFPGHAVPMRYYYYWNVVAALPAKLFRLSPRITTLAGVVWAGLALASLIPLYLKHFCEESAQLARKALVGIALLAVTGLDLIPTIRYYLSEHTILPDMEWWDWTQVTSWLDSLLWVPHHIAALVALLTGFLVLWVVPHDATMRQRAAATCVAALAFGSAAGLSVYVTFTVAIFLVIWSIILLRSRLFADFLMFAGAGAITLVLSLGYLHDLRQPGLSGEFAVFYVRALSSVQDWGETHIDSDWLLSLFLAAMLPVYYVLEMGFFALVGFARGWNFVRRKSPLAKWEWASLSMCGASLLVSSFLMSTTGNNDLGYRAPLLAQFVLLLWGVPYVFQWISAGGKRRTRWTPLALAFLIIGFLGTVYQALELRAFPYLADNTHLTDEITWLPRPDAVGWKLFQIRSGYEKLQHHVPQDAIVQYNPIAPAYVPNLYYNLRQTVAGAGACGTAFGGDPFQCMPYQNKIASLFIERHAVPWETADEVCRDLNIDVLVVQHDDRMWALRKSWVWTESPVVATSGFRAFACGNRRGEVKRWFQARR